MISEVCSLSESSQLAIELDSLQQRYKVSFIISAGNFTSIPLLDYPRPSGQLDSGRIMSPADSILGITVGSVSHKKTDLRNITRLHFPDTAAGRITSSSPISCTTAEPVQPTHRFRADPLTALGAPTTSVQS